MTIAPAREDHALKSAPGFTVLNGLVLLGVLFQGVSAGLFMGRLGTAWVHVHQITAVAMALVALAAAILAIVTLRRRPVLVAQSVGLFVLLVVETGLGEAAGDRHSLVAAHVPVAILITALSAYLTVAAARPSR
ncbi:hypothetical protein [Amycolatopsis sp. GM8]|uniref:hypothetical protein n=1 Tax=Amycolatopsis sp. GM8 TaxID=2896530 RepID=UPI001F2A68F8|nr:hypothetical protein [Amycolatopsis sp. GM8]